MDRDFEKKKELYARIKVLKKKDESGKITPDETIELKEINSEIDKLNKNKKNELTISEQALHILTEEYQLKRINEEEKNREEKKEAVIQSIVQSKKDLKKINKGSKITSASVFGVLTTLLMIPSDFFENTFISNVFKVYSKNNLSLDGFMVQAIFASLWLYSLMLCLLIWRRTSNVEKRVEDFLSVLESEENQNQIFLSFIESEDRQNRGFTKSELYNFILNENHMDELINKYSYHRILLPKVDSHAIQLSVEKVGNSIIEDGVSRGFISESINGYETIYKLTPPDK